MMYRSSNTGDLAANTGELPADLQQRLAVLTLKACRERAGLAWLKQHGIQIDG